VERAPNKSGRWAVRVETKCRRGKLEETVGEALGASVGVEYSRRGTRGQLVRGTVEVQLAENFYC